MMHDDDGDDWSLIMAQLFFWTNNSEADFELIEIYLEVLYSSITKLTNSIEKQYTL